MNDLLKKIETMNLHQIFRLKLALQIEQENPNKIAKLQNQFAVGDRIQYFNQVHNDYFYATITEKGNKYVKLCHDDGNNWHNIPYAALLIAAPEINFQRSKLSRSMIAIGETLGFTHEGREIIGQVIRLNPRTVSLHTPNACSKKWRVGYGHLYKITDSNAFEAEAAVEISAE